MEFIGVVSLGDLGYYAEENSVSIWGKPGLYKGLGYTRFRVYFAWEQAVWVKPVKVSGLWISGFFGCYLKS